MAIAISNTTLSLARGGGGENSYILGYGMCHFLGYFFSWNINFGVYFRACNKFLGEVFSLELIFGSDCYGTLNYMLILLALSKLSAVQIRHIISTSEDVQRNSVNHQVLVQGGITEK